MDEVGLLVLVYTDVIKAEIAQLLLGLCFAAAAIKLGMVMY